MSGLELGLEWELRMKWGLGLAARSSWGTRLGLGVVLRLRLSPRGEAELGKVLVGVIRAEKRYPGVVLGLRPRS